MGDIRIDTSFHNHPKTRRLRLRVGHAGVDALLGLWTFAGEHRTDGSLTGMDDVDIALAADWEGEPSDLVAALAECRFLDGSTGDYSLHDWCEHQPWVCHARERSARARKAAEARWGGDGKQEACSQHAPSMLPACRQHADSNAPSPSPSPNPEEKAEDGTSPSSPAKPRAVVPHQAVIALYHEILPELPRVETWPEHRQAFLRARCRDDPVRLDPEWWRDFFQTKVRGSPFLMGKVRANWIADLEWLIRPKNFAKVLDGRYLERKGKPGADERKDQLARLGRRDDDGQRATG